MRNQCNKIYCPFFRIYLILFFFSVNSKAQAPIFLETFDNTPPGVCDQLSLANGFLTSNGTWNVTDLGVNDSAANQWYISAAEPGLAQNTCSEHGCYVNPNHTDRTLHVGNVFNSPNASNICPTGDCGAIYDPGGIQNSVQTNKRAESPSFSMLGQTVYLLSFNYIEFGDAPNNNDNLLIEFYDGNSWAPPIADPGRTNTCGVSSTSWEKYTIILPVLAADANVKIGFRWMNDNSNGGLNKSCAVDSVIIFKLNPSIAHITASDTAFCANDCINFFADSAGPVASYNWTFFGASTPTSTQQNPLSICYPSPGVYSATLIVSTPAGVDTDAVSITVNPCLSPTADFMVSDSEFCALSCITFTDMSWGNPSSWNWLFPGGVPSSDSSANPPPVCYNTPGVYDVTLITSNQFGEDTIVKTAYLVVDSCSIGVPELSDNHIKIFPNPASASLMISIQENFLNKFEIAFYDLTGRLVMTKMISSKSDELIDISMLRVGAYLIKIFDGRIQVNNEKIIVLR